MAYITDDKRVKDILKERGVGALSTQDARQQIRDLPPQTDKQGVQIAEFGYLEWEIDEATKQRGKQ